ncbi:MAG: NAD(P)/FAD-dependent oxidoreductase [bacterium]
MDKTEVTIIGAGVIGLAIARELSSQFSDIIVLEKNDHFGRETSSRNSEVIHSGIYYPKDSLKARLCVEGAALLYDYCQAHAIPHQKLGKLIVATTEQEVGQVQALYQKGRDNGVEHLSIIDAKQIQAWEPRVPGIKALWAPNTGILNSHALMDSYYREATKAGVLFAFKSEAKHITRHGNDYEIVAGDDEYRFQSRIVINAAGLHSDHVAGLTRLDVDALGYRLHYCKGDYFYYTGAAPIHRLIYPVPHKDLTGLGVHATLDLGGRMRFGPDTEYVDRLDYTVDERKQGAFYQSACKIITGLEESRLMPDMAGIRPKLKGSGVMDFIIRHEAANGLPNFINLIGMESPGLTASLAIARHVRRLLGV